MGKIDGGLRSIFQEHLPKVHWQSIESWSTGRGVPDLNGCYRGTEVWIELKRANGWKVEVSPEQVGWIERRVRAGGKVYLAVRRVSPPQRTVRGREKALGATLGLSGTAFWLLLPSAARLLADRMALDVIPKSMILLRFSGSPGAWDWDDIGETLFPSPKRAGEKCV